jgi:hypothetical protein
MEPATSRVPPEPLPEQGALDEALGHFRYQPALNTRAILATPSDSTMVMLGALTKTSLM